MFHASVTHEFYLVFRDAKGQQQNQLRFQMMASLKETHIATIL